MYRVEVYTPDDYVNREFELTIRIKGKGGEKTEDQKLVPTESNQGYGSSFGLLTKYIFGPAHVR